MSKQILEYKVVGLYTVPSLATDLLNEYAKEGWFVVTISGGNVILSRLVEPIPSPAPLL